MYVRLCAARVNLKLHSQDAEGRVMADCFYDQVSP